MKHFQVYIAGPLTNVPEEDKERVKGLYEFMGKICEKEGMKPYIPHKEGTDPDKDKDLLDPEVYDKDRRALTECHLMLGYDSYPSRGMAAEVEIASNHNIPVVLYREEGKGKSRMLSGSLAVEQEISFRNLDQLEREIRTFLKRRRRRLSVNALETFANFLEKIPASEYNRLKDLAVRGEGPFTPEGWKEFYEKQLEPENNR